MGMVNCMPGSNDIDDTRQMLRLRPEVVTPLDRASACQLQSKDREAQDERSEAARLKMSSCRTRVKNLADLHGQLWLGALPFEQVLGTSRTCEQTV